ncbi:MAG TPA: hypothetical protein VNB67_02915 [Nitrososphaeraceae archaeon]|nr:hypothetical protein [Nitrososphaeraceae archaeon]
MANREDESLNEICLTMLSADKSTRFVGIIGIKDGKLLAGKFNKYSYFDSTTFIESNSFYRNYLLPAIKIRKKVKTGLIPKSGAVHFKLADLGDNVYLVIAPLTGREDRLLCMYVEGYPLSLVSTKTVAQ